IGRYDDAVTSNIRAVDADRAYFAQQEPSAIYRGLYFPHNLDFIWQAASMEGRSQDTIRAANEFAGSAPRAMVDQMSDMETAPSAPLVARPGCGRGGELPRGPAPPAEWPYVTGAWHYARGLAFVATGRRTDAEGELAALRRTAAAVPAGRTIAGFFKTKEMLGLAADVLPGEIAARTGQPDLAGQHFVHG